ncbi:YdeI/OmpD-associated family protein [Simiduia curdlanivorans]|uniref:YdeI/OmpD-associated family protein n=1 Tax=Simiduia curdlanivorans TaxID=1492769 RepID=A0ABV8V711_9GAMM|nr:YdeI/OmpD-associated family protein [Simiduia curdlanivorans]MDN3640878.1 YdeI/OmpD-associated family protein [Simiduia curdlanivorans]
MGTQFTARLLKPLDLSKNEHWAFVILPKEISALLPRRGRTTVQASINGCAFTVLLEPDGQKSHWLPIDAKLLKAAQVSYGDDAQFEITPVEAEPEPDVPDDLNKALKAQPEALAVWQATTTIARLDWIHWVTTAKQAKTRAKRINDACDLLASGKKRVCCFDTSGFYSKAFSAPKVADQ